MKIDPIYKNGDSCNDFLRVSSAELGDTVAIIGLGWSVTTHHTFQSCRHEVISIERVSKRLEIASKCE